MYSIVLSSDLPECGKRKTRRGIRRIFYMLADEIIINEETPDPICREKGRKNTTGIIRWRMLVGYTGLTCVP